ncbi:MAG TPA: class I SAM-dependent methyltransferase [Vicinamibacterales bacterium]|nr:class I SAM-dependent methyltransferase [Vicinamibacterales bacterium]
MNGRESASSFRGRASPCLHASAILPTVLDLSPITTGLTRGADGIWRPATADPGRVHYPDEANAFCFQVEDDSFWFQHRNAVIVDALTRFPPAGWLADLGAGNGFVARAIEAAGVETIVVEPGAAGIANARRRGLTNLVQATFEGAQFAPGTVPAAGLFDVVEHIEDDVRFLQQVNRALMRHGRLYLTVPAFDLLWSAEDDFVGHHHRYTLRRLRHRLEQTGFEVEYSTYLFAPLAIPVFLLRALPSRLGVRQSIDATKTKAELTPGSRRLVQIMNGVLSAERQIVRRGWRIPVGSSSLVVARKRDSV